MGPNSRRCPWDPGHFNARANAPSMSDVTFSRPINLPRAPSVGHLLAERTHCRRHSVEKSGTGQSIPPIRNRLATIPFANALEPSPSSLGPVARPWRSPRWRTLPERQLEQNLDRQAEPDGGLGEHRRAPGASLTRRLPCPVLVQQDQQGPALAERRVAGRPVGALLAGGMRFAHPAFLTVWIRDVNPSPQGVCKNVRYWPITARTCAVPD